MSFEIRPIRDEEIEAAEAITGYAFNSNDRLDVARRAEQTRRFYSTDWTLAGFEDGEMTTYMRMLPFVMRINGRGIPFGAVSPVAASPLHRRKGQTGAVLRESLRVMRDRGQPLSGLYTPHPAFYRRYGWEIAAGFSIYTFKPKDLRLAVQPRENGRFEHKTANDWHELDAIYRRDCLLRNGAFHRGEAWWQNSVLGLSATPPNDIVVWRDGSGEALGYMVFRQPFNESKIYVQELVALTSDAYLNLLLYIGRHDIHREVSIRAGVEDPFLNLIEDGERVETKSEYSVLVRVVDLERAIELRPPVDPEENLDFTLEVRDSSAPWNEGVWRLTQTEGRASAERTDAPARLSVTATALAPLFNGYLKPSRAAKTGLLQAHDESALAQADRFFAVHQRPHFLDGF